METDQIKFDCIVLKNDKIVNRSKHDFQVLCYVTATLPITSLETKAENLVESYTCLAV